MELLQNLIGHGNSALAVVLVLGGLIFFHELGHFSMARFLGMGVKTFSLGFGPRLLSVRRGKTDYCLSAIPLGGFVSLAGESKDVPSAEDALDTDMVDDDRIFEENELFFARPAWQRMLVIAAGPLANFLLAFLLYWCITISLGLTYLNPIIGKVTEQSPAAFAGLQEKDRIVSINGHPVSEWGDISLFINQQESGPVTVTYLRGNEEQSVRIEPTKGTATTIFGEQKSYRIIGIEYDGTTFHKKVGILSAFKQAAIQTKEMTLFTAESFTKLFQRVVPLNAVGGPIMIAQVVGKQAERGFFDVVALAALISINLGLLNLLPIPVLDGGHLVFLGLEMIFRRPVPLAVREYGMRVGIIMLLGVMLFATWNDLVRIFS